MIESKSLLSLYIVVTYQEGGERWAIWPLDGAPSPSLPGEPGPEGVTGQDAGDEQPQGGQDRADGVPEDGLLPKPLVVRGQEGDGPLELPAGLPAG